MKWRPCLIILTDGMENFRAVPVGGEAPEKESFDGVATGKTGTASPPSPREDRIMKERELDFSKEGAISRIKQRARGKQE